MSDVPDIISMLNFGHVLALAICNAKSLGPRIILPEKFLKCFQRCLRNDNSLVKILLINVSDKSSKNDILLKSLFIQI